MIKYNSDAEFVQACHDAGMVKAAVAKRIDQIIEAHKGMTETDKGLARADPVPCRYIHTALVADVLKFVITELLHIKASDDYVFNREIYEGEQR